MRLKRKGLATGIEGSGCGFVTKKIWHKKKKRSIGCGKDCDTCGRGKRKGSRQKERDRCKGCGEMKLSSVAQFRGNTLPWWGQEGKKNCLVQRYQGGQRGVAS